jgi:hypothetical protein
MKEKKEERGMIDRAADEVRSWLSNAEAEKQRQLDAHRVDNHEADTYLTTNQGVRISDNHHSLKAGERGPTLMEDFIFR